jgi:circadian clock protein KaiC
MVTRMIDLIKGRGITGFFTSLVSSSQQNYTSGEVGVSSLIDTWIVVREIEERGGARRIRGLYVVKSRGTGHSSDVHRLILSDEGIGIEPMEYDDVARPVAVGAAGPNQKKVVDKDKYDKRRAE